MTIGIGTVILYINTHMPLSYMFYIVRRMLHFGYGWRHVTIRPGAATFVVATASRARHVLRRIYCRTMSPRTLVVLSFGFLFSVWLVSKTGIGILIAQLTSVKTTSGLTEVGHCIVCVYVVTSNRHFVTHRALCSLILNIDVIYIKITITNTNKQKQ